MNTNTVQLIEKFGDKAGDVIKHFWPALVQQQVTEGYVGLAVFIAVAVIAGVLAYFSHKGYKAKSETQFMVCLIGAGALGFVLLLSGSLEAGHVITKITNPEAIAFQELINKLR